jgi:hypothetical protein
MGDPLSGRVVREGILRKWHLNWDLMTKIPGKNGKNISCRGEWQVSKDSGGSSSACVRGEWGK